jgi:hypothetical protein
MRKKTINFLNQGSFDKKIDFFPQTLSHIPRWVHLEQKTRAKNSHAWAPLIRLLIHVIRLNYAEITRNYAYFILTANYELRVSIEKATNVTALNGAIFFLNSIWIYADPDPCQVSHKKCNFYMIIYLKGLCHERNIL